MLVLSSSIAACVACQDLVLIISIHTDESDASPLHVNRPHARQLLQPVIG